MRVARQREALDGQVSKTQERSVSELIDHHGDAMSSAFGSACGHGPPSAFGVMFGHMPLLLQLGIDRLADETKTVELFLSLLTSVWRLVDLRRGKELQRTIRLKILLQSRIIAGPIAKQTLEIVGERVQEVDTVSLAKDWLSEARISSSILRYQKQHP